MFSIDYSYDNYCNLIKDVAAKMGVPVTKNFFTIPANVGNGYFKYVQLPDDLQCLITAVKLNRDLYFSQNKIAKEFYILRLNERSIADNFMFKIDREYLWEGKQRSASVLLTSSLTDFTYIASKGTTLKSINILIPKEWLLKNLTLEDADVRIKNYLTLKTEKTNFANFDIEYHTLFKDVVGNMCDVEATSAGIRDRLMMVVEKFVNELTLKLNIIKEKDKIKISTDEVKRLMKVESLLVKDFSQPPPSIAYLSRAGAMSTTSLKNKFKKMYGSPLYEYFQKSRMQRAKVLMLTHKYSIKQIGSELGYSNLSNFSIAFKKTFKYLPSEFLLSASNLERL